jgi:cell division protein FtsN
VMTGMFIGLLLGLCLALGVALYLSKSNPFVSRRADPASEKREARPDPSRSPPAGMPVARPAAPAPAPAAAAAPEPSRFDFYKILPGNDEAAPARPATPAAELREVYYLQAGAFQRSSDADDLKARLALAGLEAQIQTATRPDSSTWHRVRLGPFASAEAMNQARAVLRENKIEPRVIKQPKS